MSTGAPQFHHFEFSNVLLAGRRVAGDAWGRNESEALRRFAARQARELHVDVGAAIRGALSDPFKRISVRPRTTTETTNTGSPHGRQ